MTSSRSTALIRLARLLARLYPSDLRHAYGPDMATMVADLESTARHRPFGRLRLAVRLVLDAATAVPRAHRDARRWHAATLNHPPSTLPPRATEPAMKSLSHNLRLALRRLRTRPGFTIVAAGTMALGIGATTAIFSVLYGVLLRPLGVADPDGLAIVTLHRETVPSDTRGFWPVHVESLRAETVGRGGIREITSYLFESVTRQGDGEPEELGTSLMVDGSFFSTLGVDALVGRRLGPEDVLPNRRGTVCVISESLWQGRFGGDPGIVGRGLVLDGEPVTVVGVMPDGVPLPQVGVQLWMPQGWDVQDRRLAGRLSLLARVEPGMPMAAAERVLADGVTGLAARHERLSDYTISLRGFTDNLVGGVRPALITVGGAAALLMLIACANVASLLLSRAVGREREIATQRALGAGRLRLTFQLLTESVVLSLLGGVLGIALTGALHRLLLGLANGLVPRLHDVRIDPPVLAFAAGLSVLTGMVFGLAPALYAGATDLNRAMRQSGSVGVRRTTSRARQGLVVVQVALAVVLVAAAALFLRSLSALSSVDTGFRTAGVGGARVYLDDNAYGNDPAELAYFEQVLERLRAMPGIVEAGATSGLPMDPQTIDYDLPYTLPGKTEEDASRQAYFRAVSPGYLETLGVPLVRGRALSATDRTDGEPIALVNETFARTAWGDRDPVGETFGIYGGRRSLRVVGVVGDVRFHGHAEVTRPAFFVPMSQTVYGAMTVLARGRDGATASAAIAAAALEVDRRQPVHSHFALADIERAALASDRFFTRVLVAFGVIALLLAAAGMYGVLAYCVSESRRELGIRLALGASSGSIVGLVLGRSLRAAALGLATGLAIVLVLASRLEPHLYTVGSTDGWAMAAVVAVLAGFALAASMAPALRASRLDPVSTLRLD